MPDLNRSLMETPSCTFPGGPRWHGPLKNGLPHGRGVSKLPDGRIRYEGHMENGRFHGFGVSIDPADGTKYTGTFEAGKAHGRGVIIFPKERERYEGEFRNGAIHGEGTYTWEMRNSTYEGEFADHKRHGDGILTCPDGSRYEGAWRKNLRHGYGVLWDANGNIVHDGRWENNEPIIVNDLWAVSLDEECCICHHPFSFGDQLLVTGCHTKRHHVFHKHCLEEWLGRGHDTCPKCRKGGLKLPGTTATSDSGADESDGSTSS